MATLIGLIVNPIAGLGGPSALKGTDGADAVKLALARGAAPVAGRNAERVLKRLRDGHAQFELLAAPGPMGEHAALATGYAPKVMPSRASARTTADDTQRAARDMLQHGAQLIMFSGGDGTARDVLEAVGADTPILGIPSGVKMYSAVFATSPEAASAVIERVLAGGAGVLFRHAEVMDVNEDDIRAGRVSARLHGYARVPYERQFMPGAKAGGFPEDASLEGAVREIVEQMRPGILYFIGPGSTMQRIKRVCGFDGTLLGVDVVFDGALAGRDLTEGEIYARIADRAAHILVGLTGGQGFVFGRGNQQFSPRIIRSVGRANTTVVAGAHKLAALSGQPLRVDTGDPDLDGALAGFIRVVTGPGETAVMRIGARPPVPAS